MVEKRVDIIISEKGGVVVIRRINDIGNAARNTQDDINSLNRSLRSLGTGASAGINILKRNLDGVTTNARKSKTTMEALGGSVRKVGRNAPELRKVSNRVEEIGKRAKKSTDAVAFLRRGLALVAGAQIIRGTIRIADAYTNVQNRLKLVTNGTAELASTTKELFEISNATRISFTATAEIFSRTALAVKELGLSQKEVLAFTKSLNQAVILSGASAQEANAGLIQLSQGLASGALRGDELRSVLEQLPAVADVIAKSLKITRGELRELGQAGKISAKVILKAFKDSREELDNKFNKTVGTVGQSFTVLLNKTTAFIAVLDESTGASTALATVVLFLADNLDVLAKVLFVAVPILITYLATMNIGIVGSFAAAVISLTTAIAASGGVIIFTTVLLKAMLAVIVANPILAAVAAILLITTAIINWGTESEKTAEKLKKLREEDEKLEAASRKFSRDFLPALGGEDPFTRIRKSLKDENFLLKLNSKERSIELRVRKELKKFRSPDKEDIANVRKLIVEQLTLNGALNRQLGILRDMRKPVEEFRDALEDVTALQIAGEIGPQQAEQVLRDTTIGAGLVETESFLRNDPRADEIDRLKEQLAERQLLISQSMEVGLIKEQEFLEKKKALNERFAEDEKEIDKKIADEKIRTQQATTDLTLGNAANLASGLSALAASFAEGQDGENKKAFAIAKSFAIASSLISIAAGVAKALNNPFPANIGFAATVAAQGAVLVSQLNGANFADGGIVSGPGGPRDDLIPAQLSNGEFVIKASEVSGNRQILEAINSGRSALTTSANASTAGTVTRVGGVASSTAPGLGGNVIVNVINQPGQDSDIVRRQNGNQTEIDVIIKQVDDRLALNLRTNQGSFATELKGRIGNNI